MIPIRYTLNPSQIRSYEDILRGSPFNLDDFYYEEGNEFFVVLDIDLYHYMIYNFSEKMLKTVLPSMTIQYNKTLELLKKGEYRELFSTWVEKRVAFKKYMERLDDIKDEEKFDIFIDIYVRSEYGFTNYIDEPFLSYILGFRTSDSIYKPTFIKNTDDWIKVYRGNGVKSTNPHDAFSWTLDLSVAEWFAKRFDDRGKIYEAYIKPESIVAYITKRNEEEIILLPSKIAEIRQI